MPKMPCVRTLMDSQHVKVCKDCLNKQGTFFFQIFWSLQKEISFKISLLVVSQNLEIVC